MDAVDNRNPSVGRIRERRPRGGEVHHHPKCCPIYFDEGESLRFSAAIAVGSMFPLLEV